MRVRKSAPRPPLGGVAARKFVGCERDGLLWYCENCHRPLYAEYFELINIETQFPPVFERFYASLEHRTCRHCGTVQEPPR